MRDLPWIAAAAWEPGGATWSWHREHDRIRALEITIEPGALGSLSTLSVVERDDRRPGGADRHYEDAGRTFESPRSATSPIGPKGIWMDPEGPHAVENIDMCGCDALRVEPRREST